MDVAPFTSPGEPAPPAAPDSYPQQPLMDTIEDCADCLEDLRAVMRGELAGLTSECAATLQHCTQTMASWLANEVGTAGQYLESIWCSLQGYLSTELTTSAASLQTILRRLPAGHPLLAQLGSPDTIQSVTAGPQRTGASATPKGQRGKPTKRSGRPGKPASGPLLQTPASSPTAPQPPRTTGTLPDDGRTLPRPSGSTDGLPQSDTGWTVGSVVRGVFQPALSDLSKQEAQEALAQATSLRPELTWEAHAPPETGQTLPPVAPAGLPVVQRPGRPFLPPIPANLTNGRIETNGHATTNICPDLGGSLGAPRPGPVPPIVTRVAPPRPGPQTCPT